MGTRADFYVGKGTQAEWLGSIAWDGYRDGIPDAILNAVSEDTFRAEVNSFIAGRRDGSFPDNGWPWPWDDSRMTDCSYWFFDGQVWDDAGAVYLSCQEPWPGEDGLEGLEPIHYTWT